MGYVGNSPALDETVSSSQIVDLTVATADIAADAITGAKIADDAIDSEHYTDASIDVAHMAANSVDSDQYVDASIDNAHLADDAVGVAELSATGTASSSTFLRGDNAWAAPSGVTLSGSTDNTVATVTGANAVQGESTLTFDGSALVVGGTNPSITIGDAGAEDTKLVFDGNAQDYYIGLDDTDDDFKIGLGSAVGTTPHIVIDETGAVTNPLQPAFSARGNADVLTNNLAVDTVHTVTFDTEHFDINGDYDNSSYTFTAPVTGKYQLNANVGLNNIDDGSDYYSIEIRTSNRRYSTIFAFNGADSDPSWHTFALSQLCDMDASDTAYVTVYQAGGSAQSDITGHDVVGRTIFTGHLAC